MRNRPCRRVTEPLRSKLAHGLLDTMSQHTPCIYKEAGEVERDHTRQIARIGNNPNQIARWANTHAAPIDAVEIIANLVYISQTLDELARVGREADDAR